ncbi:hypothetical protein [Citrobacter koseri]|uniref:hypothetical protein n=1 Tax=Citrobacter koseri TaxID=545 RepID=UPI003AAE5E7C
MSTCLLGSRNRVKQAEAVLNQWAENPRDDYERTLIMAVMTLLEGVGDSIQQAETKLEPSKQ